MPTTLADFFRYWDCPAAHRGVRVRLLLEALERRNPGARPYVRAAAVHAYLDANG